MAEAETGADTEAEATMREKDECIERARAEQEKNQGPNRGIFDPSP